MPFCVRFWSILILWNYHIIRNYEVVVIVYVECKLLIISWQYHYIQGRRQKFFSGGAKVEKIEVFFISGRAKIEEKFYVFGTKKREWLRCR